MTHRPLVSVIVPAKDQAPYISDALASLALQFDDPAALEVLVVDDGSTDGTGELAASFAARLPGLRVLRNESPQGVADARNAGLRAATGELVAFLDPDDWLAPGHLPALAAALHSLDVDFVRCDHVQVTEGNRTLHRAPQARRAVPLDPRADILPVEAASMVDYCFVWAGLFRKSALEETGAHFPAGVHTAEDRPWIWNLHLNAASYAVVNAPGVFYRRGVTTSLTQVYDERQLDFGACYLDIFGQVTASTEPALYWPKAARQYLAVACHHLGRKENWPPHLHGRLHAVITEGLAAIPAQVLAGALDDLDVERRTALLPLLPLLPGGPGRFAGSASAVSGAPVGVSA
ncbi:glycosyltransferase family 2 protein [Arthrobacter ginkgonis]|uniref:Glycosyltransferase family 2 protein n=1 Tax=Arthrobacter ginkgonis TaxID=1630594 RepID=A0ABP7CCH7_9MICC